jgi:hypothetical protein
VEVSGELHASAALHPLSKFVEPAYLYYVCHDQEFESRQGLGIFLLTTASTSALGPTQPPIQWLPAVLSLGIKRPGREADHSPPSNAEVKECVELYLHSPIPLHGVVLS